MVVDSISNKREFLIIIASVKEPKRGYLKWINVFISGANNANPNMINSPAPAHHKFGLESFTEASRDNFQKLLKISTRCRR
jgi:hypothetical protein